MELSKIKETVTVFQDSDVLTLEYGLSKITIPKSDNYSKLLDAIINKKEFKSTSEFEKDELKLVKLFINQGYIAYNINDVITLRQAKEIFDSIRVRWYNDYYSHPLWNLLRKGELNRNGLLAWLIHNYHVSRSAGMTDARFFSQTSNLKLKEAYKESCFEEYSHCDEFYFVEHQNLNVRDEDVRNYVHLPGSLAFDQQMLRMSEDCWLGHVFISYFQEATVSYYDDCKPFYSDVEKAYGINDFFNRWKQHVELDLDYGHFEHFESIFSPDETVSKVFFEKALNNAWITFKHLYYSLDQIIEEEKKSTAILLRNPISNLTFDASKTSLLSKYRLESKIVFDNCKTLAGVFSKLQNEHFFNHFGMTEYDISITDKQFFYNDIRNLVMKSLGFSKNHYTTILLGNFLQENDIKIAEANSCSSPDLMAVSNFMNELTYKPENFIFILRSLIESPLSSIIGISANTKPLLDKFLGSISFQNTFFIDEVLNSFLQLNELLFNLIQTKEKFVSDHELK